jgi:hypothetical protein
MTEWCKIVGSIMFTLEDLKNKLMQLDEVTLMETLEISSEDLVNRFSDYIENKQEYLSGEFDEQTPWDND